MKFTSSQLQDFLTYLHQRYNDDRTGAVANYIPELAKINPNKFAISITLASGETLSIGNDRDEFTIQSVSKPFTYAWALDLFSEEQVMKFVGVEPTGEEFNSVIKLEKSPIPLNAMVNAGSISVAGMLYREYGQRAQSELVERFSKFAGRKLSVNQKVFKSEYETGDRNRALAYILKYKGLLTEEVDQVLSLYFKQCSVNLNVRDLSTMGSVFINAGVHPITGEYLAGLQTIKNTLSVMLSCGMYNYSGHWLYDIGLPAKSGVSGALLMLVPGVMSVAVYSPRVDELGSSVRAIDVCREISNSLGLHIFGGRPD